MTVPHVALAQAGYGLRFIIAIRVKFARGDGTWSVVGRLLDSFDKEIARSVLFLSPVLLATRQSVIDD